MEARDAWDLLIKACADGSCYRTYVCASPHDWNPSQLTVQDGNSNLGDEGNVGKIYNRTQWEDGMRKMRQIMGGCHIFHVPGSCQVTCCIKPLRWGWVGGLEDKAWEQESRHTSPLCTSVSTSVKRGNLGLPAFGTCFELNGGKVLINKELSGFIWKHHILWTGFCRELKLHLLLWASRH